MSQDLTNRPVPWIRKTSHVVGEEKKRQQLQEQPQLESKQTDRHDTISIQNLRHTSHHPDYLLAQIIQSQRTGPSELGVF